MTEGSSSSEGTGSSCTRKKAGHSSREVIAGVATGVGSGAGAATSKEAPCASTVELSSNAGVVLTKGEDASTKTGDASAKTGDALWKSGDASAKTKEASAKMEEASAK